MHQSCTNDIEIQWFKEGCRTPQIYNRQQIGKKDAEKLISVSFESDSENLEVNSSRGSA